MAVPAESTTLAALPFIPPEAQKLASGGPPCSRANSSTMCAHRVVAPWSPHPMASTRAFSSTRRMGGGMLAASRRAMNCARARVGPTAAPPSATESFTSSTADIPSPLRRSTNGTRTGELHQLAHVLQPFDVHHRVRQGRHAARAENRAGQALELALKLLVAHRVLDGALRMVDLGDKRSAVLERHADAARHPTWQGWIGFETGHRAKPPDLRVADVAIVVLRQQCLALQKRHSERERERDLC